MTYTRKFNGKSEKISEKYTIYTAPVYHEVNGDPTLTHNMFETEVVKMDPKFSDRLYLVDNLMRQYAKATRMIWNNPNGGAMEWNFYPMNAIIDTRGEVRWYMHVEPIYDVEQMYRSGVMMGFQQDEDGNITACPRATSTSRTRLTLRRSATCSSAPQAATTAVPTTSACARCAT